MGRPVGSKDPLYAEKRRKLILRIRDRLGRFGAVRASWRELAESANVSLSTLTHYFGKRDAVIVAILEEDLLLGAKPLAELAQPRSTLSQSVDHAIGYVAFGLKQGGLGDSCVIGLQEGLRDPIVGPAFVRFTLEPVLQSIAAKLRYHQNTGEMRPCDLRVASMLLLSPVLFASLHQSELSGHIEFSVRLMDLWKEHAAGFCLLYQKS